MAAALAGEDHVRSMSSRRVSSFRSGSKRSWALTSFKEVWTGQGDVFLKSGRANDEEELKWVAIKRLPTFDRLRKGMLKQVLEDGKVNYEEVDVTNLGMEEKKNLMESMLKVVEEDNEQFLRRLRDRTDRCVSLSVV